MKQREINFPYARTTRTGKFCACGLKACFGWFRHCREVETENEASTNMWLTKINAVPKRRFVVPLSPPFSYNGWESLTLGAVGCAVCQCFLLAGVGRLREWMVTRAKIKPKHQENPWSKEFPISYPSFLLIILFVCLFSTVKLPLMNYW